MVCFTCFSSRETSGKSGDSIIPHRGCVVHTIQMSVYDERLGESTMMIES